VQINFQLSLRLSDSLSPKFRLSPNEKIDFTFRLNFGLSETNAKREVAQWSSRPQPLLMGLGESPPDAE